MLSVLSSDAGLVSQYLRSHAGENLKLSSPTGSLSLSGPQETKLTSFGGSVRVDARQHVEIGGSRTKRIVLHGSSFRMPNITRPVKQHHRGQGRRRSHNSKGLVGQYQLCACKDGTLFMVEPEELCVADYHVCAAA